MIIINEKLKNGFMLCHENLPHLFDENDKQTKDLFCEFDKDGNLIVETTINNAIELKNKLDEFLTRRLEFCNKIIKQAQELEREKMAIKIMLGNETGGETL